MREHPEMAAPQPDRSDRSEEESRAGDALRECEARLRLALDIGRLGLWEWDIAEGRVTASPELARIRGLGPGGFEGTPEAFTAAIHHDDRARVLEALERTVRDRKRSYSTRYRVVRPDGAVRWISTRARLLLDDRGRPLRLLGVSADETEREEAERTQRFLTEASAILGSSLDYEQTISRVSDLVVPELADWCVVYIAEAGELEPVALSHADPEKVALARRLQERYPPDPEPEIGAYRVFRTGEPQLLPDISQEMLEATARDEEHLRILRSLGLRSAIIVPLTARDRTLGVLSLVDAGSGRRFDEDDMAFVRTLADRAALAVDNARLFEEVTAAEERADFIAEAGGVLTASLDHETTLRALARLAVPRIADWCIVDVLEPGPKVEVRRIATEHVDPAKRELLAELHRRYPPAPGSWQPASIALFEGESVLLQAPTDAELERRTRDREHLRMVRELGVGSAIAVPLIARGETLGALTVAIVDPARAYGPGDMALVTELARRAATAIDNARLYERALVASRAKSDFLTVMSHELRTPLNAALGYADLLDAGLAGRLNAAQTKQVDRLTANLRQLLGLVERILEFTQVEVGREGVQVEAFDLVDAIRDVVGLIRPRVLEKGLALSTELPPGPVRIETDGEKLRSIALSLLSNAEKFTDAGEIQIRALRHDDALVIEVRDTGIGIPEDQIDRVFEPFEQVARPTTRRIGGIGLGLTMARRMARLLGGDIEAESEPGRGSTFRVRLPVRWLSDEHGDGGG